jgi:predicted nucleotidyltransferase
MDVREGALRNTDGLPEHGRVLRAVFEYFRPQSVGAFVSGSTAAGGMDEQSDLDVGIVFETAAQRDAAWKQRWDWDIAPWFHRFDADHVKPHFVIYLFEPQVKTDLPLYTVDELPPAAGGPYTVAWDDTGRLDAWAPGAVPEPEKPDWSTAVHEEERVWAWLFYSLQHVRRGEYYSIAGDFGALRDVVEQWQARLSGLSEFTFRRAEQRVETAELARLFPGPEKDELKQAMLALIDLHDRQREQLDLPWRTTDEARARIRQWIADL